MILSIEALTAGLTATLAVIAAVGLVVGYAVKDRVLKAPFTVVAIVLIVGLGIVVQSLQRSSDERDRARNTAELALTQYNSEVNRYNSEQRDYDQCTAKVQTRSDLRGAFIGIYNLFDAQAVANGKPAGTGPLRQLLDQQYPTLDDSACKKPTPVSITPPTGAAPAAAQPEGSTP